LCLKLGRSAIAFDPELFLGIVIHNSFVGRLPYHPETHHGRLAHGIEGGPIRLINDWDIFHLEGGALPAGTDDESLFGHRDYPIQPGGRNGGVKIVDLVCRGSLPLKQGESYVGERPSLRSARGPVFSLHKPVIGCGCAEGDPIASVVGAYTREIGAPGNTAFEMVDVRWLKARAGRLVVAAVLVQPRYRIGISAAIVGSQFRLRLGFGDTVASKHHRGCSCRSNSKRGA